MLFRVAVIPAKIARPLIVRYHYSKCWPTGNFISFGAFVDGRFCGVATYGYPANSNNWKSIPGLRLNTSREMSELTRLWIADWAPPFVESRTIGASLRVLRRDALSRVAISYADPKQGHLGIVYQATNWIYLGQMKPSAQLLFSDGALMHKRAAFDRYGTDNPARLRSVDPGVRSACVPGKHKYAYPVDKALSGQLRMLSKPYPTRRPVEGFSFPEENDGADPISALSSPPQPDRARHRGQGE